MRCQLQDWLHQLTSCSIGLRCRNREAHPPRGLFAEATGKRSDALKAARAKCQPALQSIEEHHNKGRSGGTAGGSAQAAGAALASASDEQHTAAVQRQPAASPPELSAPAALQPPDCTAPAGVAAARDGVASAAEVVCLLDDSEPQTDGLSPHPIAPARAHMARVLMDSEPQSEEQPAATTLQQRRQLQMLSDSDDEDAPAFHQAASPPADAAGSGPSEQAAGEDPKLGVGAEALAAHSVPRQQLTSPPASSPPTEKENTTPNAAATVPPFGRKRQRLPAVGTPGHDEIEQAAPCGHSPLAAHASAAAASSPADTATPDAGASGGSPCTGLEHLMTPGAKAWHHECVQRRKSGL